jgi:hypothetical protein
MFLCYTVTESEPGTLACTFSSIYPASLNSHKRTWSVITLHLLHCDPLVLLSLRDTDIPILMSVRAVTLRSAGQAAIIYRLLNSTQLAYTASDSVVWRKSYR